MRLLKQRFRGLTRFTGAEPVEVDFSAMGPGLIAVVGANGSGKTTFCEALPAALFKRFPTRPGSLYEWCSGRDAFIEAILSPREGEYLKVRLLIDAERKTTEGLVFESEDAALDGGSWHPLTDGKRDSFKACIEERFGSESLFLASIFAAQDKSGNFLLMKAMERKRLFAEMMPILAALEAMYEKAKTNGAAASLELEKARAALAEVLEPGALEDAQGELDQAEADASSATAALRERRDEELEALTLLAGEKVKGDAFQRLSDDLLTALEGEQRAQREVDAAGDEPDTLGELHEKQLASINARRVDELEPAARRRFKKRVGEAEEKQRVVLEALAKYPILEEAEPRLALAKEAIQAVRVAEEAYRETRTAVKGLELEEASARREMGRLEAAFVDDTERLEQILELKERVPCTKAESWSRPTTGAASALAARRPEDLAGSCPLLKEAREAGAALEDEERAQAAHNARGSWQERERALKQGKQHEAAVTAELGDLELMRRSAENGLEKAEQLVQLSQRAQARRDALPDLEELKAALTEALEEDLRVGRDHCARAQVDRMAANNLLLKQLEACDKRMERAGEELKRASDARAGLQTERDEASQAVGLEAAQGAAEEATSIRKAAEKVASWSVSAVATAGQKVKELEARALRARKLREQEASAAVEAADWKLLSDALGRNGIQALEIDAAGPEVAALTNRLLEACYGPRFAVRFETLREKKSAPGEFTEAFDLQVFDEGRAIAVEGLSGGERVIIGEAVGLALAVYNARKSDIRWETMFRDETAGALDPENAQAYIRMLREAAKIGGFHQIVFVSHQPEVWEAADAQLRVAGGKVSPQSSSAAEAA